MDLQKQLQNLRHDLLEKMAEVLDSGSYIHGHYVARFEEQFATLHGVPHCAGCANGTSALFLALAASGIGPGDEVITTPHTFIATAEAISHTGATPVFADIDPLTYTIDPTSAERAVTPRTRAIVPVHLYGCPADMDSLEAIARRHNLLMVEDCAQAHLAKFRGQAVGTFGVAGSFSFYPGKNLGACGDAGAVIANDPQLIAIARKLLNHGRAEKYIHDMIGYNHRMDELQAGFLEVKLKYLSDWTAKRQSHAQRYTQLLMGHPHIKTPVVPVDADHVFHLFVVQVNDRDRIMLELRQQGVETSIHYPLPLHLQPAYRHLGYRKGDFPVTELVASRILSLPLFPELLPEQIDYVCARLLGAV